MKNCDQCGAANATRAQFCNACGAKFRIADAVAASEIDLGKKDAPKETPLATRRRETDGGAQTDATATAQAFWTTFAAIFSALWKTLKFVVRRGGPILLAALRKAPAFFSALGAWVKIGWRKSKPAREKMVADAPKYASAAWSRVRVALAPSATWTPAQIPNFLIWGVVDFFLWRLPFSIVGIFYAILANEAKRTNDVELARIRAAKAKGWLLADLAFGVSLTILAAFGLLGSFFFRAIF